MLGCRQKGGFLKTTRIGKGDDARAWMRLGLERVVMGMGELSAFKMLEDLTSSFHATALSVEVRVRWTALPVTLCSGIMASLVKCGDGRRREKRVMTDQ
jgi:hypothetical protein